MTAPRGKRRPHEEEAPIQDAGPVLVIAGPTASGKSRLAADLAEAVGGVVINADSMQVYRELRVLSARPDDAALARAPHRLYRSEEHTSELQSLMRISYAVFCLKKKHKRMTPTKHTDNNQ